MHKLTGGRNLKAIRFIVMAGAMLSVTTGFAIAGEVVTEDQIVRALAPKKPLTRGLSIATPADQAADAAQGKFIDSLRNRPTRSLSSGERNQLAEIAQTKPNIDMEITFDYNSANISAAAQPAIQALGRALSNPDLQIRRGDLQYLVWDSYSANRSPHFAAKLLQFAEKYHGRVVHSESVDVTAGGQKTKKRVIVIYEVRP